MGGKEQSVNLYRISQGVNSGWDIYDSAVVAAESEEIARRMHPGNGELLNPPGTWSGYDWARAETQVFVELLGECNPARNRSVICASFNAG